MHDNSTIALHPRTKNLLGQPFGRLTVIAFAGYKPYRSNPLRREPYWQCLCHEGNIVEIRAACLLSKKTQSCGCLNKERTKATSTIHGKRQSSLYAIWASMIQRCKNPANPAYDRYGGRGITVCQAWHTFAAFYADMGDRPANMTLERRDNNQGYSPENCYWATRHQQSRNTRQNVLLTYNGLTQCLEDWARQFGLNTGTLRSRLKNWDSLERALTTSPIFDTERRRAGMLGKNRKR